jgi:putative serine protease PepD
LIAQVGPSVVRVDAGAASGSGLVIDAQGTIVTPASLVAGLQQVTITVASGQQYSGTVAGSDPASDVAVIRITGAAALIAVTLADSGTVQVGDVVVAVGHQVVPSGTASYGIVSGLAGTLSSGSLTLTGLVQTTAPMASGTSGSALVNISGQVIGMTTLGASAFPGPGVAIPSNQVSAVSKTLLAGGTQAGTAYLGVTSADATGGGALIQSVAAGSPGAVAGLQAGWIILAIDGQSVARAASIAQILATHKPGQRVVLTVQLPNGSTRSIPVVLGTK